MTVPHRLVKALFIGAVVLASSHAIAADDATAFRGIHLGQSLLEARAALASADFSLSVMACTGCYQFKIHRHETICGMANTINGRLFELKLLPCYFELPENVPLRRFYALMIQQYEIAGVFADHENPFVLIEQEGYTDGENITLIGGFSPAIVITKKREPQF